MLRLHPVASFEEARALTASGPVDLCIVHPHSLEAVPTGRFPLYPFDPMLTPAILIAADASRETVRLAVAGGYRVVLASPAAPRLVYRRIGSILQKVRRRGRNRTPKLAPAVAAHDKDNRITVPGFYEGADDLDPEIRAHWMNLAFDGKRFLADLGLNVPAGEKGRHILEQLWSRPTCDMNGIVGGYTGVGSKTVIPARASAKISFRLVGDQDPLKVRDAFRAFVTSRLPADCEAEFISHGASAALRLPLNSPYLAKTRAALEAEWGRPAVLKGSGGSIPIVGAFKHDLGMDSLLSASASMTTASIRRTRNTISSRFRRGRAVGRGF